MASSSRRFAAFTLLTLATTLIAATSESSKEYSLAFDPSAYTVKTATYDGQAFSYRAYEGIVYVKYPVDLKYQTINFYARAEFYEGKSVGGYTAGTAPIWYPNSIGGYMPGPADAPGIGRDGKANSITQALAAGLVVAAPGARGRTLKDSSGAYYGKAPAVIVDLKAAVRYLRLNDKAMPGDAERIVSNGTSAGGAVSALLGATGNNADYAPYLKALGAADARDDIFAVSAYCPITNLDNADAAYEWLLGGLSETKAQGMMGPPPDGAPDEADKGAGAGLAEGQVAAGNAWGAPDGQGGTLTDDQKKLSAQLTALFPAYINGLRLKKADGTPLTLDAKGSGSFKDYLKSLAIASAQAALKAGTDMSQFPFVTVVNGAVSDIGWEGFIKFMGRKKAVPSFDAIDLSSGENNLFGTQTVDNQHFTAFGQSNNSVKGASFADAKLVRMMNPMYYIGAPGATTSKYWRIRHGTVDSDTSIAIPTILASYLGNKGYAVDFVLPWNVPHSGDNDLPDNFAWIASIAK